MQWYYTVSSQTFGPFDEELLLQWIRTGALPSDVLVWREGKDGWEPALRAFPGAGLPRPPPPTPRPQPPPPPDTHTSEHTPALPAARPISGAG